MDVPADPTADTGTADIPIECLDSDGDGVCDADDRCHGYDDALDIDDDGVPDGCDTCRGGDDRIDSDGDGTPDYCDCDSRGSECHVLAVCYSISDGIDCSCITGYTGDGFVCEDVDECVHGLDFCDEHATCINTSGSYDCVCDEGYEGDGFTCTPTDTSVIFTEEMNGLGTAGCAEWEVFRSLLTGIYSSITMKGSYDEVGLTCSGTEANLIW
jgi:hypothetical protein